jgi:hypothetical protein
MKILLFLITNILLPHNIFSKNVNNTIKNALKSIKIDENNKGIKIFSHKDLIIFNGIDQLFYYNEEKNIHKFIKIKNFSQYNLLKIVGNDTYFILFFNNYRGVVVIVDKINFTCQYQYVEDVITNGVLLENNQFVITNLNNSITSYKTNGQVQWHHSHPYSQLIFKNNQNLIFDKYLYWIFNNNLIYVLDPLRGNVEEDIFLGDKVIINILTNEKFLIIMTNKSVEIYNKVSLSLVKSWENIYPISNGVVGKNHLYFHDNKKLFIYDLDKATYESIFLKSEDVVVRLLDPLILNDLIIMATIAGKWYVVWNKKTYILDLWKLWSDVFPVIYHDNIYIYQNFSSKYFEVFNSQDIKKLLK